LIGAMIAVALLGVSLLMTLASGLQVWLSQSPAWPWFKASLAAFLCSLILMVIMLGKEFHWWYVDGETLDYLANRLDRADADRLCRHLVDGALARRCSPLSSGQDGVSAPSQH
jgi:hypothetical protein